MKKLKHAEEQRGIGRQQVMDAIRTAGAIARIDIAKETMVSPATVTAITAELLEAGLIEEIAPDEPRGTGKRGRPRVALKVRGDACLIAGLKVARDSITALIVDFEGTEIVSHEAVLSRPVMTPDQFAETIRDVLDQTCAEAGFDLSRLSGVGIGIAGLVDAPRAQVHWSPSLDRRDVDLAEAFAGKFDFPVFVDNDANLVAKAEQLFGLGRNVANFIVITIEYGVGMGVVIDHKLYRGAHGCGAEFGHSKVQFEGALCQCGQRGCLEAYIGDYALLREANAIISGPPITDLTALWEAAQKGDKLACAVFERAGRMFALGLANVVNIFDPELIVLAGQRAAFDHLNLKKSLSDMQAYVVQVDGLMTEVKVNHWGDLMWAKGAAAYAIDGVSAARIRELAANVG